MITTSIESYRSNRATIVTSYSRLVFINELHGPELGSPAQRTRGKTYREQFEGIGFWSNHAGYFTNEMNHMRIVINLFKLGYLYIGTHTAQIISCKVYKH